LSVSDTSRRDSSFNVMLTGLDEGGTLFRISRPKDFLFVKALRPDLGPTEGSFEGRKVVAAWKWLHASI